MKQKLIEEEIAILESRLNSKGILPTSSLFDQMIDDIDTILNKYDTTLLSNGSNDVYCNEFHKLNQSKTDIIHRTIITGRQMIENLEKTIFNQREKHFYKHPDYPSIIIAIDNRRIHMSKRTNYMKQYKLKLYFGCKSADQPTTNQHKP
jgi:hypothetical protein